MRDGAALLGEKNVDEEILELLHIRNKSDNEDFREY